MGERTAKPEKKKKLGGLFSAALVLLLLALVGFQLLNMRNRLMAAEEERSELAERVAKQQQENRSIEAALDRAEDPEYLQELARDQLGMVSPGQRDFYDVSN